MAKRRMVLPSRFYRVDSVAGTVSVRSPKTGRFKGRRKTSGYGDKTRAMRVSRNVDVNHDKKIDFFGGTILGRRPVSFRASRRAKGYERRV